MKTANRLLLTVVCVAGVAPQTATAQSSEDIWTPKSAFSAEATIEHSGQPKLTIQIYYDRDKERMERISGGRASVIILRRDKDAIWRLMPAQKKFVKISAKNPQGFGRKPDGKVTLTRIGPENVNGVGTTKYKIVTKNGRTEYDGHIWVTKDNIQIRYDGQVTTQGKKGSLKIDLKKLKLGQPKATLFEIPDGYTDSRSQ